MEYWNDEREPIKAFVTLFEKAKTDDDLRNGLQKVNQLIWFDYTEDGPNCSFHVDCRDGNISVAPGKPGEDPDLTMSLSADDAHRSWSNKLNPVMAITRKKIRVKGSATGLLKLAPKLKKVAKIYAEVLKDLGWEDKILK
jgi:putative sterol carrier protein